MDFAWPIEKLVERRVPFRPIRPLELDLEHVLSVFPCLMKLETVLVVWIDVQRRALEGRFVAHRVKDRVQKRLEPVPLIRADLKGYDVCFAHPETPR
jgi:hypothetical protein